MPDATSRLAGVVTALIHGENGARAKTAGTGPAIPPIHTQSMKREAI
jgi:hypothetical protein